LAIGSKQQPGNSTKYTEETNYSDRDLTAASHNRPGSRSPHLAASKIADAQDRRDRIDRLIEEKARIEGKKP
jgi:hypothetical protein